MEIFVIYNWVAYTVVCQTIVLFGVVSNIISIICFFKQGFKDPVNVSLLGLAVSDLGSLTTMVWTNLCLNPAFGSLDLPFNPIEVQYLITARPHTAFTCITAWITALITVERCFCIISPLKSKAIITSKRVAIVVASIFTIMLSGLIPVYIVNKLGMKYYPHINKTIIGLIYMKDREPVENMCFRINNFALPFCAFLITVVCTITINVQLKINTQWHTTKSLMVSAERVSTRNEKVAQMVIMISTLFIVCFIPNSISMICMTFIPSFNMRGKHYRVLFMMAGLGIILESTNSSANICIYYKISSKYKKTFKQLFARRNAGA